VPSKFEEAVETILRHEGGYVNHPNDPGGATNYGVSLRFLRGLDGLEGDFDGDGDVDANDILKMTKEDAIAIYKKHWWDKFGYERLDDQRLATKVFDMAVNMGAPRAHKLLQQALGRRGFPVTVDGMLGPKTVEACNSFLSPACFYGTAKMLYTTVQDVLADFYTSLVKNNPKFKPFLKGWLNRAYDRI